MATLIAPDNLGQGVAEPAKIVAPAGFRVVLVNPPADIVREEIYDLPAYPSISIGYIASYLERAGVTPLIADARLSRWTFDETVERVVAMRPDVVGVTTFTHTVMLASKFAEAVKQRLPDVVVVAGGYHVSFLPERSLHEFPAFDYIVVGEGEIAFRDLIEAIANGEREPSIHGVWYLRKGGEVVAAGRGDVTPNLDDFGAPAWHLFDQEDFRKNVRYLPIMTMRGCPFSCNFCSRPYGQVVRRRTPSRVVDELEAGEKVYGITRIEFHDETFTVNKPHTTGICEEIIQRGLKTRWRATAHANTVNDQLVDLMKRAGCAEVSFGVESGDEKILAAMGKHITKDRILAASKMFRKAGIHAMGLFIIGHPNETWKSAWASIRFAAKLKVNTISLGIMVPYPGTEVWELATRGEGGYRKVSPDWNDFNKIVGNAVELEGLPRWKLQFLQIAGYLYVFTMTLNFRELFRILIDERKRVFTVARNLVNKIFLGKRFETPMLPDRQSS